MVMPWTKMSLYSGSNCTLKFTDTVDDAWYLRTVFVGNVDSVAAYKHWFHNDRKVRGCDVRYTTDFKFGFVI